MTHPTTDRRICFVSMEAYATLSPGAAAEAGGAGFQVVQIARGLRDRGTPVDFVVGDYGQPFRRTVDGFTTWRANRVAYDRNLLRGVANLWRLFRAMRAARAHHYVLRSTRFLSWFVWIYTRILGGRYTFMVANLPNVAREELEGMPRLFRRLYALSLRRADRVTVQSEEQRALLEANFGVTGPIVPNGIEVPPFVEDPPPPTHDLAWVATLKTAKRPDRLLEIARELPGRTFLVAGGPGADAGYSERVGRDLAALPNVEFLGFVPPDRVGEVYARARMFLNTSAYEGFPNTFLYAWSRGVPVASLEIDPDGVVAAGGLGLVDPDPATLARRIDDLLGDPDAYRSMRRRCHAHVSQRHSITQLVDAFASALPR